MAYIGKRPVDTFPAINAVTSTLIAENNITAREIATNTIVTLLVIYFLYQIIPWFLDWSIFSADFTHNYKGEKIIDRTFCSRVANPEEYHGACWSIIIVRFYQFIYGFYPVDKVWRVNVTYFLLAVALIPLLVEQLPYRKHLIKFTIVFV